MRAERVHGILGYYDGVLDGVADFQGTPNAFLLDGDIDAEAPRYRLKPLTTEQLALFVEYWRMWRRWENAFDLGQVTAAPPPVLAADRERHAELEPLVKEALAIPTHAGAVARGTFRRATDTREAPDGRWGGFEVVWTPL